MPYILICQANDNCWEMWPKPSFQDLSSPSVRYYLLHFKVICRVTNATQWILQDVLHVLHLQEVTGVLDEKWAEIVVLMVIEGKYDSTSILQQMILLGTETDALFYKCDII